jgi:isoquinoline 1-oxidoreductase beta subunit
MNHDLLLDEFPEPERYELREAPAYTFDMNRRQFVQVMGAGLLLTMTLRGEAQVRGGGARNQPISARLHIGADGVITVMTSKVEVGQGSRTEITQAAAEELRVPIEQIKLIMADTAAVPDDGGTAGSRTTPSTLPAVQRGCAAARAMLIALAAKKWSADPSKLIAKAGRVTDPESKRGITYGELAAAEGYDEAIAQTIPADIQLTPVEKYEVLGKSVPCVNSLAVVTGQQRYTPDIRLPGMLYGAVLRAPAYNATLKSVDLSPAKAMEGVIAVHDGDFVGVAAPTLTQAEAARDAIKAEWDIQPHPPSKNLGQYLKEHTSQSEGGGGRGRSSPGKGNVALGLAAAAKKLEASYDIAYIQHAPMETRAALAQWENGGLTVWTGSQMPSRVAGDLARTFRVPAEKVRVVIPDTGGGFGGKHSGECAVEAARLAKAAGKPVSLQWSREEEFAWAYFRPAGLIEIAAGLDSEGKIVAWDFTNYNSGGSAIASPYDAPHIRTQFKSCDQPLRSGSYRALASTANIFARESFIDELCAAAGADPL